MIESSFEFVAAAASAASTPAAAPGPSFGFATVGFGVTIVAVFGFGLFVFGSTCGGLGRFGFFAFLGQSLFLGGGSFDLGFDLVAQIDLAGAFAFTVR